MPSLMRILWKVVPHEIYNLAAQSHVRISFDQPAFTTHADALGVLNLLEAVKSICPETRIYQAGSSEMFGNQSDDDGYAEKQHLWFPLVLTVARNFMLIIYVKYIAHPMTCLFLMVFYSTMNLQEEVLIS